MVRLLGMPASWRRKRRERQSIIHNNRGVKEEEEQLRYNPHHHCNNNNNGNYCCCRHALCAGGGADCSQQPPLRGWTIEVPDVTEESEVSSSYGNHHHFLYHCNNNNDDYSIVSGLTMETALLAQPVQSPTRRASTGKCTLVLASGTFPSSNDFYNNHRSNNDNNPSVEVTDGAEEDDERQDHNHVVTCPTRITTTEKDNDISVPADYDCEKNSSLEPNITSPHRSTNYTTTSSSSSSKNDRVVVTPRQVSVLASGSWLSHSQILPQDPSSSSSPPLTSNDNKDNQEDGAEEEEMTNQIRTSSHAPSLSAVIQGQQTFFWKHFPSSLSPVVPSTKAWLTPPEKEESTTSFCADVSSSEEEEPVHVDDGVGIQVSISV